MARLEWVVVEDSRVHQDQLLLFTFNHSQEWVRSEDPDAPYLYDRRDSYYYYYYYWYPDHLYHRNHR